MRLRGVRAGLGLWLVAALGAGCAQGSLSEFGGTSADQSTAGEQPIQSDPQGMSGTPGSSPSMTSGTAGTPSPSPNGMRDASVPQAPVVPDAGPSTGGSDAGESDAAMSSSMGNCTDGMKNGLETGSDCGGPMCPACADGLGCFADTDCVSMHCGTGFLCEAPSCEDERLNGDESDFDCGGSCPGCAPGELCEEDGDCAMWPCGDDGRCEPCPPRTAADCTEMQCGSIDDGCGGTVECPDVCASGMTCNEGMCCQPRTADDCGEMQCGSIDDGCGGTVECATDCGEGGICRNGMCCQPRTAQDCPASNCGTMSDGCGGTVRCPNRCPTNCGFLQQACCSNEGRCGCNLTGGQLLCN